jgi:hypothetical protein
VETEKILGKVPEMVGIEEELFQAPSISEHILWNCRQGTMTLVHILHLTVAPLQEGREALEHCQQMKMNEREN